MTVVYTSITFTLWVYEVSQQPCQIHTHFRPDAAATGIKPLMEKII